jgi:K319-like protein
MRPIRTALATTSLLWCCLAGAQQPPPPRFVVVGHIQAATLDAGGAVCIPRDPLLAGGTLSVGGLTLTVPCNTIVQLPATSLAWAQLFDPAVAAAVPGGGGAPAPGLSGLALGEGPQPAPGFMAHATGNVVNGRYVVGLLSILTADGGAGPVRCIDHASGALYVGGAPAPGPCSAVHGARVRIDDPVGRYGLPHSPDPRFTADTGNPTIRAVTGYPVCVPRLAPPATDPGCPQGNRPLNGDLRFPVDPLLPLGAFLTRFDLAPPVDGLLPDARLQLPLEVGDWITFSGVVRRDATGPYLSAHTLVANLGVFTAPGVPPAYVAVDEVAIGTRGAGDPAIPQEGTTEFTVLGTTTDPTRPIDIAAIDVNPCTGAEAVRVLASVDPGSQPVRGLFHFGVGGGAFMPPTRELLVTSRTGVAPGVANGLVAGQYRLPIPVFLFPGNRIFGQPIVPANFEDLFFLANGSGPLFGTGPVVSQLDPWPGAAAPVRAACSGSGAPPSVSAGADLAVDAGALVTLAGSATADPDGGAPLVEWTQTFGTPVVLADPGALRTTFTAPAIPPLGAPDQLGFELRVINAFGTGTAQVGVTVSAPRDVVSITAAVWRSTDGTLVVNARSSSASLAVGLEVVGYGAMTTTTPGTYRFSQAGTARPTTVTVRSTLGGTASAPVTIR